MRPRRPAPRWLVPLGFGALVVLPLLAALGNTIGQLDDRWWPVGDSAVLELGTRDAGRDPGLLGPYSRYGWNHPGPALFYVLALPYRLTGDTSLALVLAAVLVNLAAVVGIAALALRRGGRGLLAGTLVLVALLLRLLGPELLRDPWNPFVTVLPLALLVFLCWSVADGDAVLLPVAVGVGSGVVQTHLGYAFVVVALLAGGLGLLLAGARRRGGLRPLVVPVLVAGVVAAALWAPVVAEELTGEPGNLTLLQRYLDTPRDTVGVGDAAGLAATQLGRLTAWTLGQDEAAADDLAADGPGWPAALAGGAAVVAVAVALRRRDGSTVRLAALGVLFAVAAVLAVAGVEGAVYAYLVEWVVVGGLVAWVVVAGAARGLLARTGPLVAAGVLVAVIGTPGVADAWRRPLPQAGRSGVARELAQEVRAELGPRPAPCPVLVRFGPVTGWVHGVGVGLQLERGGWDVRTEEAWAPMGGRRATGPPAGGDLVLTVSDYGARRGAGPLVASAADVRVTRTGSC